MEFNADSPSQDELWELEESFPCHGRQVEHPIRMAYLKTSFLLQMNDCPGCVLTPGTEERVLIKGKENAVCPAPCPSSGCVALQSHGHS